MNNSEGYKGTVLCQVLVDGSGGGTATVERPLELFMEPLVGDKVDMLADGTLEVSIVTLAYKPLGVVDPLHEAIAKVTCEDLVVTSGVYAATIASLETAGWVSVP